ncbi:MULTISPECIES: hypothetical protein [Kribbella]|uniref:Glycogen debranching protein n=1 Tax=Kribbella karoonensis TaxID=324851 RepID=A0ABN2DC05_9ACTN
MSASSVALIGPPGPATAFAAAGLLFVRYDELPADLTAYRAVVVLAGNYPEPTRLASAPLAEYVRGGGTAYVEFAVDDGFLPGGPVRDAHIERIFTREALTGIEPLSILDEHLSRAQEVVAPEGATELLTYGSVAGTHKAVFGPPEHTFPALLDIPVGTGRLLYATTALSHHIQGRYKPVRRWRRLLQLISANLVGADAPPDLEVFTEPHVWVASGEPVKLVVRGPEKPQTDLELVEASPGRYESEPSVLPDGEHTFAVGNQTTTITVGPRRERYRRMIDRGIAWFDRAGMFYDAPDGSEGVAEGFSNEIGFDGKLPFRPVPRGDCYTQTAHAFRMYADLTGETRGHTVAENLMRHVVEEEQLTDRNYLYGAFEPRGARTDLTATNNLFADDGGWISLFALISGHLESGLRGVESLIRTANTELGLQVDPWRTPSTLMVKGWDEFGRSPIEDGLDLTSHWQSSALCAYLYAYGITGEASYLEIAERGLDHMASHHPRARLETSRTCEAGRFLLPLAGGYFYTRKPLYLRTMLDLAEYLKSRQGPDGGFAEWDGKCPPSNEAYGVDEASIFQANGDPVTDQLYGTPFAAWALPIVHQITGEPVFEELAHGVLDYLSRIQIDDPDDDQLDGTWQRAFDFDAWEYFGSNADIGWGPYCVETGWSVAPTLIAAMQYLHGRPFFPPAPAAAASATGAASVVASVRAEFDSIRRGEPAEPAFHRREDGRIVRVQGGVPAVLGDLRAVGEPAWARNEPVNSYEIYVRGADNHLHHTYLDDRVGQGRWQQLGDLELADDPVVAFNPGADAVEVYVLGADRRIHHCSMIDVRGGHTPWEPVGTLHFTGSPAVMYDEKLGSVRLVANDTAGQDRRTRKVNRWHLPWQDYSHWITA